MKTICSNCQKVIHSEPELKHVFPDIPNLLDRISPGETVPLGECPKCGFLVHADADVEPGRLVCSLCHEPVDEAKLREHLAMHHPGAEQLSWEAVRNQFRLQENTSPDTDKSGETNIEKVQWLLDCIQGADVIVVADSPYLHRVDIDAATGNPDNRVLRACWHDDEGLEFEVKFTEAGLLHARIEDHTVIAEADEGEETKIELFRLQPMTARPVAGRKEESRKVVISVTGGVATAEEWPADVEVEIRDYDTEGCDPKDLAPDGSRVARYRKSK